MSPLFIVALVLVIVGMVLNSIGLAFNQRPRSEDFRLTSDKAAAIGCPRENGSAVKPDVPGAVIV
jgi:hypothetical protein